MFVAGIDMGAKSTKVLILDEQKQIQGKSVVKTRPDFPAVAKEALGAALQQSGLEEEELSYIATTGFGRYNVPFRDIQITEITSVARGAVFLFPKTRCVLDIGAQSTRAIRVLENGKVREFRTNDKCAAGAGGFIERAAKYLEVKVEEVGDLSVRAQKPQTISSVCAVLAESEIINHVSAGETVEDILRGVHNSLASRALALMKRAGLEDEVTFVGGVARQIGMVKAMEAAMKKKVNVCEEPDMVGALGAGILALRRLEKVGQNGGKSTTTEAKLA
ncbi:MAG: acyl-CoA dehydratase activase [Candidatus Binatia bacterium]